MNEDDDQEEETMAVVKYPCMPSLVALQQMRNRLHLAYVGKKLMKWTSQATGRELRRIAMELAQNSADFSEEVRDAFILLARARYFFPNLNKMVLEHVGRESNITVSYKTRSISGVKVLHFIIDERGKAPYQHLGIAKGGQAILEAKQAWKELLKRSILILELRTSFEQVDIANKNANKRENVLKKHFIPKIHATIHYIIHGLEEIEREDMYRIKLIKNKKKMKVEVEKDRKKSDDDHVSPICNQQSSAETIIETKVEEKPQPLAGELEIMKEEKKQEGTPYGRSRIGPEDEMYIPMSSCTFESRRPIEPLKLLAIGKTSTEMNEDVLKQRLNDVITLSKKFLESGFGSVNMVDFLTACEDVKARIEMFFKNEAPAEIDDRMKNRLDHLKLHLREVMEITKEFQNDTFLSPSVENFAQICEEVDEKINIYMKTIDSQPVTDVTKSRLYDLKSQIKDVVTITEEYKQQGLLTPSVEKFLQSCEVVKSKIDLYTKEMVDEGSEKVSHLKMHLRKLEKMAIDVKQDGFTSPSLENFLIACKDFKTKLNDYKKNKKSPTEDGLHKLVSQLDETISLSKEAKKSGLISESVEDFIKSCENIKLKIQTEKNKSKMKSQQPEVLDALKYNIDDVIEMVNKCEAEGLVTESIENFIKSLETTKAKIDATQNYQHKDSEFRIVYPSCSAACTCGENKSNVHDLCDRCEEELIKESPFASYVSPPCDFCQETVNKPSVEIPESCVDSCKNQTPEEQSQDLSEMCEVCKRFMEEEAEVCTPKAVEDVKPIEPQPVDNTLGYFERNVRKITKVTRTQNTDGTIREETETITIRKIKHDPTQNTFDDNDDVYGGEGSYESVLEDMNEKKVATCVTPEQNQRGFMWKSKSECCARARRLPTIRHSVSITDFRFPSI